MLGNFVSLGFCCGCDCWSLSINSTLAAPFTNISLHLSFRFLSLGFSLFDASLLRLSVTNEIVLHFMERLMLSRFLGILVYDIEECRYSLCAYGA